jgi:hypothetical protein
LVSIEKVFLVELDRIVHSGLLIELITLSFIPASQGKVQYGGKEIVRRYSREDCALCLAVAA